MAGKSARAETVPGRAHPRKPRDKLAPVPDGPFQPHLSWTGDRTLRIALGDDASLETHTRVRSAFLRLRDSGLPSLRDITPAYATLLLTFALEALDPERVEERVRRVLAAPEDDAVLPPVRLHELPVCYDADCAPDLDDVARSAGLSRDEVVARHAGADYVVHFIGFTPGFPYLGGLPSRLSTPRLERPRVRVPAGSVAIAGSQTGIYPHATPGGWRLIGRTPVALFDPTGEPPALLAMGDRVRFVSVTHEQFERLWSGSAPP